MENHKTTNKHHRAILKEIAYRTMLERGLLPDFSREALAELGQIQLSAAIDGNTTRDLRDLLWASIDNDDSRDLDQLTVAEAMPGGMLKIFVAVADVDSLVNKGSAIDRHARHNTTSVYTAGTIFPMLPEKLSTDLTSLNPGEDRAAVVIEYVVDGGGTPHGTAVYRALVNNKAKLAYDAVDAWRDGRGPMPEAMAKAPGVDAQIRLQETAAQKLRARRYEEGALDLETIEARAVFEGEEI